MAGKLIVVSLRDQRLVFDARQLALRSVPAMGDNVTSMVLESKEAIPAQPNADPPEPRRKPVRRRRPDLDMSLISGLPTEVDERLLTFTITRPKFEVFSETGPLSFTRLTELQAKVPSGTQHIVILGHGNDD